MDPSLRIFLIVKGLNADFGPCVLQHQVLVSLGLQNADLAGLDADLIIPASSVSSAFGRGCAGLDADLIIPASSASSAFGL